MIHLRSLAAFLRDICAACRPPADDTTALAEAVGGVMKVAAWDDHGYHDVRDEPTPEYAALMAHFARIDAAVECFADEIAAIGDAELRELCEGRWSE